MEVTELTAETFWKGETEIRGTVMDGEDEYRVRILRKGSQNFDYSCSHISKTGRNLGFCGVSCTQGPDGIPMCPHAHALLAEWIRRESRESKHPVSTSQKVRFMVREYTNREVSRIMGASEEGHYRLVPIVAISREQVKVRFTVGREKQYPVKDLTAFAKAMENMSLVQYGKGLAFHHSLQAFDEESHRRIRRHRCMRAGKGFETVERYTGLNELVLPKGSVVLLECMSNLVANEMFREDGFHPEVAGEITDGVKNILSQAEHVVIVTNEIFSDGILYEGESEKYKEQLGQINCNLAEMADSVVEVVYGIPVWHKGGEKA